VEHRVSMSWFTVAVLVGVVLLALSGHPLAGRWSAAGLAALAALMHAVYLVQRRGARHMAQVFGDRRDGGLFPRDRRMLDRFTVLY
jgi:hypothetical protein